MNKWHLILILWFLLGGCREAVKQADPQSGGEIRKWTPRYAKGFAVDSTASGAVYLRVYKPWPGATRSYRYALVPRKTPGPTPHEKDSVDGIIRVPVQRVILTSTTHIPSLETLGMEDRLVGFPGLDYISSPATRRRIDSGAVRELGANEQLNTERVLSLQPDLVVGFGVSGAPDAYQVLEASGIPLVYNADWMEEAPLGKAEWIVFFGLLLGESERALRAFEKVEKAYLEARQLAAGATHTPSVISGALYRDVWYLPAGDSWAAQFFRDANARYLWADSPGQGSLSLSLETVIEKGTEAEFWIAPAQFTSYAQMAEANTHYTRFRAFRDRKIYTYSLSRGPGSGLWYYERGPSRPDLVLKDLIHWLHPGLLPAYTPVFFKPLEP